MRFGSIHAEATALLEFVNLRPSRSGAQVEVSELALDDILGMLVRSGLLQPADASIASANHGAESATSLLAEARRIHHILRDILGTLADGRDLTPMHTVALNDVVAERRQDVLLSLSPRGLVWSIESRDPVNEALSRVTWFAVELLTDRERTARIRRCSGDCGALFMDFTKNGSRRWCEMRGCGNRAKARRYYQRKRSLGSEAQRGSQADGVP